MTKGWTSTSWRGPASDFHARDPDRDRVRELWWFDVDRPALVLGSAQAESTVDVERCARDDIEVVRRRSGGGSVLMIPGEILWADIVVPADDALWDPDVGRSMWWVGELWADVLAGLGVDGAEVHRGPLRSTPWSRIVCFDGVGSGEVLVGGRKAVGVSQRRTRHWSRIQTAVHLRWRADQVTGLVHPPDGGGPGPVAPWTLPVGIEPVHVFEALEAALPDR